MVAIRACHGGAHVRVVALMIVSFLLPWVAYAVIVLMVASTVYMNL